MSNIIKPHFYVTLDDRKQINVAAIPISSVDAKAAAAHEPPEIQQARDWKEQILQDAESAAEERLRQAMAESQQLAEEAQAQIESWWNERRTLDDEVAEEARRLGYEAGLEEGRIQAEQEVQAHYQEMLSEAKSVLEQAYRMKDEIIREAEPFLIELSTAIAEKIIQHQLDAHPEWVMQLVRSTLSRTREKGAITLCVSPGDYSYLRDARDELRLSVDSQAELQIVPDASVGAHGCVIRTAFGSMDARVDTQLREIKQALQQIAVTEEEEAE